MKLLKVILLHQTTMIKLAHKAVIFIKMKLKRKLLKELKNGRAQICIQTSVKTFVKLSKEA